MPIIEENVSKNDGRQEPPNETRVRWKIGCRGKCEVRAVCVQAVRVFCNFRLRSEGKAPTTESRIVNMRVPPALYG